MKRSYVRLSVSLIAIVLLIGAPTLAADKHTVTVQNVRSGNSTLRQEGRLTVLEIKSQSGALQRIALSHPSDYRQGTNAPYAAELVAESPGQFLVFTDTFASNPGNVQGRCGASESGERFLHVVALGAMPHETLSLLVSSCLLGLEPSSRSPEWIPKRDSAGFIGLIAISFEDKAQPSVNYYVAPDGSVTRPQVSLK